MNDETGDRPSTNPALTRIPTGIPGLDAILKGGLFRGGIYMILARPGSGKTILGNQICFRHVAAGGRALVVTLLTESHARMIARLATLAFFDPSCVGTTMSYVTGYQDLEKGKLKGLLGLLRKTVRDHKATLLMIDGLVTAGSMADSELESKKFIHELQVFVELIGCTTLLLTGATDTNDQYPLRTMVEGLIELRTDAVGMESARTLEVTKFRGSPVLMGRHLFEITEAGITVNPRTESMQDTQLEPPASTAPPAKFGIEGLDAMLGDGLRPGSVTLVLGSPGCGKSLLGLTFLAAGGQKGERGLYFGFFERASDLGRKADAIGLGLGESVASGMVEILSQSPLGCNADAFAGNMLARVRELGIKRLFIDGLEGFRESLVYADRSRRFFTALCRELRSLGVVTIVSDETRPADVEAPGHGLTSILDNVIFLRQVDVGSQVHSLVSVVKRREGGGKLGLGEFSIGPNGFVVSPASAGAEAIPPNKRRSRSIR